MLHDRIQQVKGSMEFNLNIEVLDGFDADGKPRTRKPAGDITLRQLMLHTSGTGMGDPDNQDYIRRVTDRHPMLATLGLVAALAGAIAGLVVAVA